MYKKPIFYYVVVPLLVGLWPCWLLIMGIPFAKSSLQTEIDEYVKAQKLINEILSDLDPQRLDYAKTKKKGEAFDFITAVDQVTGVCKISPTGYRLSSSPMRKVKGGQTSQDASMTIENIDIERFTKFLSVMHMRWSSLQCSNVLLSKIKGEKNAWKTEVRFIYYQ